MMTRLDRGGRNDPDGVRDRSLVHKLIGCDFGAPRRAGEQARKIIAIEAIEIDTGHYAIKTSGFNARLAHWPNDRPGWTIPALRDWLLCDRTVQVAAFDFPFSVPLSLLQSAKFAGRMQVSEPFRNRDAWAKFVASRLALTFKREGPSGEMADLAAFEPWRDTVLWERRSCDIATKACPPLKHIGQNVFAMTLAGTAFLEALQSAGYEVLLGQTVSERSPVLFETYPSLVARQIGFDGSYKKEPVRCLQSAVSYLARQRIRLDFAPEIRTFCESYRSGGKAADPDGADAFLCLVAAICYRNGLAEVIYGDAPPDQRAQEGGIVAPS
jgi:hypothetical protein